MCRWHGWSAASAGGLGDRKSGELRLRFISCALMLAAVGCAGPVPRSGSLEPSRQPYLVDIPLPVGFVLADHSSEDWSSGPVRFVRHRYEGRADKTSVRAFYRRQMPLIRWTPVSESSVDGRHALSFRRAKETCRITIDGRGRSPRGRLSVEVVIAPDIGPANHPRE